jgi:hypothetical protein
MKRLRARKENEPVQGRSGGRIENGIFLDFYLQCIPDLMVTPDLSLFLNSG